MFLRSFRNVMSAQAATLVVAVLLVPPSRAEDEPPLVTYSWYCENWGNPSWGDASGSIRSFWETMSSTPNFGSVSMCDLDPNNPFYAATGYQDVVYWGFHCWAEIWLANSSESADPHLVEVELSEGEWENPETIRIASASVVVTNTSPGERYVFDFGVRDVFVTTFRLILKIVYQGPVGGTQIYWNSVSHPTGVHFEGRVGVERLSWERIKSLYAR